MSNEQFSTGAQRGAQNDKPRLDLIDPTFELAIAKVLADNGRPPPDGYGENNWKKGMPYSRLYASMRRHLLAWYLGEEDEDHLAHLTCNAMFAINYGPRVKSGALPASLDDRPQTPEDQIYFRAPAELAPGHRALGTFGYMPELDYPRDIEPERLVPRPGAWDWAVRQIKAGHLVRRVDWASRPWCILRYKWCDHSVKGAYGDTGRWCTNVVDSTDRESTDWEIYHPVVEPKEGSSEWALEKMKGGQRVEYFNPEMLKTEIQYYHKNGKVVYDSKTEPCIVESAYNGPGCPGDYSTLWSVPTHPDGRWKVVPTPGTSEWALEQMQQGRKVIPLHQERRGTCEYYLHNGKVYFLGVCGVIMEANNGPGCKGDEEKTNRAFLRWEVVQCST